MSGSKLNVKNVIEITNNISLKERETVFTHRVTDAVLTMASINTAKVIELDLIKRLGGAEKTKGIHLSISNDRYGYHGR